jgi:hypothetical protein
VVRRCVRSRNLVNEEAMTHWGAVEPKTNKANKQRNKQTNQACSYLALLYLSPDCMMCHVVRNTTVREVLYYQQLHVSALHMAIIMLEYNLIISYINVCGSSKKARPMSTVTEQVYISIHKCLSVCDLGSILIVTC